MEFDDFLFYFVGVLLLVALVLFLCYIIFGFFFPCSFDHFFCLTDFCCECGSRVHDICPNCSINVDSFSYCPYCGYSLS